MTLAPAVVLDGIQLVCGDNSNMEKKVQTMRAGWANDPVHPNGHIYAKMALNLIEKVAGASGHQSAAAGGRKRSWSSSNRDEETPGTSGKQRQGDRYGGVGGSGGGSGGSDSRRSDSYEGGNRGAGGSAGRTTGRSADWKMRGGNTEYGQPGRGGQQYYSSGSGGRASGNSGGGGHGGGGGARGQFGGGGRGGRGTGGYNAGRGGYCY
jgi:hypothetical protein